MTDPDHLRRDFDAFVEELWADLDEGKALPVEHYLARYPRIAGRVRVEHAACLRIEEARTDRRQDPAPDGRAGFRHQILDRARSHCGFPVLGRNVIFDLLGEGGMGVVFRGWNLEMRNEVAVKVLVRRSFDEEATLVPLVLAGKHEEARFRREARLGARLAHPGFVRVHEVGESGGVSYFVMDRVHGVNLQEYRSLCRDLHVRTALGVIGDAARALAAAHGSGIIHRDVTPRNIMISTEGEVKVIDLGLAKSLVAESVLTHEDDRMGAPGFRAPEQMLDPTSAREAADVFGLCATLRFLLVDADATRVPTRRRELLEICARRWPEDSAAFVEDLVDLVHRGTQKAPEARFRDARVLVGRIETLLEDGGRVPRTDVIAAQVAPRAVFTNGFAPELAPRIAAEVTVDRQQRSARSRRRQRRRTMAWFLGALLGLLGIGLAVALRM